MVHYISPFKDKEFRKWLREEKNIDDDILFAFGSKGLIMSYRREFNKSKKKR